MSLLAVLMLSGSSTLSGLATHCELSTPRRLGTATQSPNNVIVQWHRELLTPRRLGTATQSPNNAILQWRSSRSYVVVKSDYASVLSLMHAGKELVYTIKDRSIYCLLASIRTFILGVALILLTNASFQSQLIWAVAHILLLSCHFIAGSLPTKLNWDFSPYHVREQKVVTPSGEERTSDSISLLWTIIALVKSTEWMNISHAVPQTTVWKRWQEQAAKHAKESVIRHVAAKDLDVVAGRGSNPSIETDSICWEIPDWNARVSWDIINGMELGLGSSALGKLRSLVPSTTSIRSIAIKSGDWVPLLVRVLFFGDGDTLLGNTTIHRRSDHQRFRQMLRRLLQLLGSKLKTEASNRKEKVAGVLLQVHASTVAEQVAGKAGPTKESLRDWFNDFTGSDRDVTELPLSDDGDEDSPAGDLIAQDDDEDIFGEVALLRNFILASHAYRLFLEHLFPLVRFSYVQRLDEILGAVPDDKGFSFQELRVAVSERRWLSKREVPFSQAVSTTLEDKMKAFVEDHLSERWNWWPLRSRSLPLEIGYTRLYWNCSCGEDRSTDLPASIALELQDALRAIPSWPTPLTTATPTAGSVGLPHTSSPSLTSTSQNIARSTASANVPSLGSGMASTGTAPPTRTNKQSGQTQSSTQNEHVFLGARRALDLRIADLQVHGMNDEDFFRRLKYDYRQLRGRLRLWLSWWRFDHCEFFRFEKFAEDEFVPRIADFPHINDLEYKYLPKPIDPRPPISKHEFRKRFYNSCNQPSSWHRPWHSCKKFCTQGRQALTVVPKRTRVLETGGDTREDFWGILAQERRYFAWVLGYFIMTLVPSIVFFFMWLFQWNHVNDLQNASVPLTMTLRLLAVFAAVLWQDRAVAWED
ncbi:hypothetical protein LTR15_011365 [Elasticomyces elasticus]|nr:hypothetical protein LTR15_011365 [Elasticomyces elasticus]